MVEPARRPAVHTGASVQAPASDDFSLLRRMRAGDERALGALYDRWSTRVHSLALHLLGEVRDAEDIVEETFWQAWREAERYEEARGAVSTWLLTIARSRALDRLRARRRSREDTAVDDLDAELAGADDPAEEAGLADVSRRVRAAVRTLPAEQRGAIELAYFGGLSQAEIAERTGQPLGTVKTRMRLAMAKLRDQLSMLRERSGEAQA